MVTSRRMSSKVLAVILSIVVCMAYSAVFMGTPAISHAASAKAKVKSTTLPLQKKQTINPSKNISLAGDKVVKVTSSKKKIVKVVSKTKIKALKTGKATIKVKLKSGTTAKYTVKVQKGKVAVKSVVLDASAIADPVRGGFDYKVKAEPRPVSYKGKIYYSSSSKSIASISSSGKITAKAEGTATIKAKAGKKSASAKITVYAPPVIDCYNGTFVGDFEANGVESFKGVPFAKQPVDNLRWKAPVAPDASTETFDAQNYGHTSIQYEWHSEEASYNEQGEDCLSLNIWKDKSVAAGDKKPIMFFIHGGGYGWGGSADPLYSGKFIVAEHPDVVVVSCNYRVGLLGFADFSAVPGGEACPDAPYLGFLDVMQGLKWVQQNAASFGGDKDNVTIFGESAGAGLVSCLMACKDAEGLFNRAIAESGGVSFTQTRDEFANALTPDDFDGKGDFTAKFEEGQEGISLAECLMQMSGAKNMDELLAIPEEELVELYTNTTFDETELVMNDYYSLPLRGEGSPIPAHPYDAISDGVNADVDFLAGSNGDEWRYWIDECLPLSVMDWETMAYYASLGYLDEEYAFKSLDEAVDMGLLYYQYSYLAPLTYKVEMITEIMDAKANLDAAKKIIKGDSNMEDWEVNTEVINELSYRLPSLEFASRHADKGGKSYVYLFDKKRKDIPVMGACHATELAYVFHNLEDEIFTGTVDPKLADAMCSAWVNFAKTGDPSTADFTWSKYDTANRNIMYVDSDSKQVMKKDPLQDLHDQLHYLVELY